MAYSPVVNYFPILCFITLICCKNLSFIMILSHFCLLNASFLKLPDACLNYIFYVDSFISYDVILTHTVVVLALHVPATVLSLYHVYAENSSDRIFKLFNNTFKWYDDIFLFIIILSLVIFWKTSYRGMVIILVKFYYHIFIIYNALKRISDYQMWVVEL